MRIVKYGVKMYRRYFATGPEHVPELRQ